MNSSHIFALLAASGAFAGMDMSIPYYQSCDKAEKLLKPKQKSETSQYYMDRAKERREKREKKKAENAEKSRKKS